MRLVYELIVAFFATAAFSVVFNVPARFMLAGGLTGAIGWLIFSLLGKQNDALFLASIGVGLIAELGARWLKAPVQVIAVPGIIPLVPGGSAYSTMLLAVRGDNMAAIGKGIETLFAAGAIAVGVALASIPFRFLKQRREKNVPETMR